MCERNWKKKIWIVSKKGEIWIFIRLEKKNNEAGYDKSAIPRILLLRREKKELMSVFWQKFFLSRYTKCTYLLSDENRQIYSNYRLLILLYLIITIEKCFK